MMKKQFLTALLVFAAGICLSSCGDDDDDTPVIDKPVVDNPAGTSDPSPSAAQAVDLGLPSGTKWANMNVGATTPEGYGDYFAWGETTPKNDYSWDNYKWCNGSTSDGYYPDFLTKYNAYSDYGTVDNKWVLDPEDDAATVNWGSSWRTPTEQEMEELVDNTISTWTAQNGVYGRKYTSKTNGNSIFLPAAGCRAHGWTEGKYGKPGEEGSYWTSSLSTILYPYTLEFDSEYGGCTVSAERCDGLSVRPVLK